MNPLVVNTLRASTHWIEISRFTCRGALLGAAAMRILISGICGFAGSTVAKCLLGNAVLPGIVDRARAVDHIYYYSDLRKMCAHYPSWDITQSLEETVRQIVEAWKTRHKTA